MDGKLDCCVVRDLLPTYIEELTEQETSKQVAAHLAECPDCRELEATLRAEVPVESAPKRALKFLKKVKRTRLVAAFLTLIVTLGCMWALYDSQFHWKKDLGSLSACLQEHVGWTDKAEGSTARALDTLEMGRDLYVSFLMEGSRGNIHGIATLERGVNGKYQFLRASYDPFPYTAGVWGVQVWQDVEERFFLFAGEGCREIYGFTAEFAVSGGESERYVTRTFPVEEGTFLIAWAPDELDFDPAAGEYVSLFDDHTVLLDKDGEDVTDQYRDESVVDHGGGGVGAAELFLLYWFLAIVALLGGILIRYFLT